jgi:hypothetical protein
MLSASESPFGGVGESGWGKEGSLMGIEDYVVTKAVSHILQLHAAVDRLADWSRTDQHRHQRLSTATTSRCHTTPSLSLDTLRPRPHGSPS